MTWKSCDFLNYLLLTRSSLQDTVDKAMSVFLYKSMLIGQEILSVSVKWGSTVRPLSTMRSQQQKNAILVYLSGKKAWQKLITF